MVQPDIAEAWAAIHENTPDGRLVGKPGYIASVPVWFVVSLLLPDAPRETPEEQAEGERRYNERQDAFWAAEAESREREAKSPT